MVGAPHDAAFILPVYFGPRHRLESAYQWQYAFKGTSMQMIVGTILLLAFFNATLWLKRPRETVYAWFAAGLVDGCVVHQGHLTQARGQLAERGRVRGAADGAARVARVQRAPVIWRKIRSVSADGLSPACSPSVRRQSAITRPASAGLPRAASASMSRR